MGEGDSISKGFYIFIMVGTLVAGALNNIMVKNQDEAEDPDTGKKFFHPFIQTLIMFIAEFACFVAFFIALKTNPKFRENHDEEERQAELQGLRTKGVWWIPAIPTVCDLTGTCFQMISLAFINQSVYTMLRGGVPIFTAVLSIIFLKKKLLKAQYLGLVFAVIGITIVGIVGYNNSSKDANNSNIVVGLICVFGSLCTTAVQFVVEEKIFQRNHFHPLKMVGMEGAFGILYTIIALVVACNIPCDSSSPSCNANGKFEDFANGMKNIFTNGLLLLFVLLGMVSLGFFNFFGMSITKYVSSLARAILLISTTVVIWVYALIRGEPFSWLQLIGFLVLVTGNLIYQKVIPLKFLDPAENDRTESLVKGSRQSSSKASFGKVSIHEPIVHDAVVRDGDRDY